MIPQADKRIKRRPIPELAADQDEYCRIVQDMVANGGSLISDPNWLVGDDRSDVPSAYDREAALHFALSEEAFLQRFSKMKPLMNAWVGGARVPTPTAISKYRHFLERNDPLMLWEVNVEKPIDGIRLLEPDFGTLMDLNLLYGFSRGGRLTRILEVGGGYGRLTEAAFNIFGGSVRYVLVDAVPASLYYSKKYLTHACPDARIRSYYDAEGAFDFEEYDISIVPSWHFEKLNRISYDLCVNIESMQEMNQHHVDYYLNLFDSVAADEAIIYLSNSHDYYFKGSFRYPTHWQKLFCSNTPRSWTRDHPTEMFRKTKTDCSFQNAIQDANYRYGLWMQNDPKEFIIRNGPESVIAPAIKALAHRMRSKVRARTRLQHLSSRIRGLKNIS